MQEKLELKTLEEWRKRWDRIYSEELMGYKWDMEEVTPTPLRSILKDFLQPRRPLRENDVVLEIGCGHGRQILSLFDKVKEVHGTDISASALNRSKEIYRNVPNVHFHVGTDLVALFPEKRFDIIYSITVFQHLPKEQTRLYFKQAHQLLKEGGVFFFNVFAPYKCGRLDAQLADLVPGEKVPVLCHSEEELRTDLGECGFKEINIDYFPVENPANPDYGWFVVAAR